MTGKSIDFFKYGVPLRGLAKLLGFKIGSEDLPDFFVKFRVERHAGCKYNSLSES
jgi:hypothetical protein